MNQHHQTSKKAVCLVSGGMDSLVSLALALEQSYDVHALHVHYGQKTASKEQACFQDITNFYKIPTNKRKILHLDFLKDIGGSSLTDQSIAVSSFEGTTEHIPQSYVPFRNSILLSLCVSWAEVLQAKAIFIGAVEEDSSGYPDCRQSYYKVFNQLIKEGSTCQELSIHTPVITFSKADIVKKAFDLQAPLHLTWSCYARNDKACGVCDSCALRLRGFEKAGKEDPIAYEVRPSYLLKSHSSSEH